MSGIAARTPSSICHGGLLIWGSGLVLCRRYRKTPMSHAQKVPKRKRRRKAMPMLGAAGLSLSLANGASAAIAGAAADISTGDTGASHEIILAEEEISDVSLATFYVFDKETAGTFRPGLRLAMGGSCGACGGCGGCRRLRLLDGHELHSPGLRQRCRFTFGQAGAQIYPRAQVRAEEPLSRAINSSYRDHARLKVPSSSRQD